MRLCIFSEYRWLMTDSCARVAGGYSPEILLIFVQRGKYRQFGHSRILHICTTSMVIERLPRKSLRSLELESAGVLWLPDDSGRPFFEHSAEKLGVESNSSFFCASRIVQENLYGNSPTTCRLYQIKRSSLTKCSTSIGLNLKLIAGLIPDLALIARISIVADLTQKIGNTHGTYKDTASFPCFCVGNHTDLRYESPSLDA